MKFSLKGLLLTAFFGLLGMSSFGADGPSVGDAAPAFKLPGSDGKTYDLASFAGKQAVVVAWYPKAFTGG